jgi:uncharacterized protein (UPF0147 family)
MAEEIETKTPFQINNVEYMLEDLTDEQRVKVNLVSFADQKINRVQAEINVMMIGKDHLIKELEDELNDGNTPEAEET